VATYYANLAKYIEFVYYFMLFEDLTNYYSDSCANTIAYHVVNNQSKEIYYVEKKALAITYMIDSL
jgi:hypothetical protein